MPHHNACHPTGYIGQMPQATMWLPERGDVRPQEEGVSKAKAVVEREDQVRSVLFRTRGLVAGVAAKLCYICTYSLLLTTSKLPASGGCSPYPSAA
mmetsp:Transcript_54125/g.89312  ORF Transcript_54125/g.89312 Transcript_54125/m.89312 type:complete len:96 (+) Transcript_54125:106-393(+)